MSVEVTRVGCAAGTPEVWFLDARRAEIGAAGLRACARALTGCAPAPHTTRSYRYPYALVAWHTDAVGVDIERIEPFDPVFASSICTPSERVEWSELPDPHEYLTSVWSSKEALAKALGDAVDYDPRRLAAPVHWPAGRAGRWQAVALPIRRGHVAWLCWRSPGFQENPELPLTPVSPAARILWS